MKKEYAWDEGETILTSPEQLNDYIRVSNPSVWVVIGAIALLLICVAYWAFSSNVHSHQHGWGIASAGEMVSFLDEDAIEVIAAGQEVEIDGTDIRGHVKYVSSTPISRNTAVMRLGGSEAYSAMLADMNYTVLIDAEGVPDGVYSVSFVIDSAKIVSFVLN